MIYVAHIIDIFPTLVSNYFSPHEMLYKTAADFNQLKVFGSLFYSSTLPTNRKKFVPRASKCVFIGFKTRTKGYVLLNIQSREIFVFRDVIFYEHIFSYQKVKDISNKNDSHNILYQNPFTEYQLVLSQPSQAIFVAIVPCYNVEDNSNNDHALNIEVPEEICSYSDQNLNKAHETIQSIRMSTQKKRPPEYLKDYHCNLNVFNTSSKVKYHLNSVLSYNKLSPSYTSFVMFISSHVEPNTYSEAVKHDCWREAIHCEISASESNQT